MADNNPKFRLYADKFNADGMTDENSLANALLTQPDVLSPVLTHLAGREDKRFPLSFLTEGMNKVQYIQGEEYDFPVIGELNKTIRAIKLLSGTGVNNTIIKVVFAEKWFMRQNVIGNGTLMFRVQEDPVQGEEGWIYTLQSPNPDAALTFQNSDFADKNFAILFSSASMSGSTGNESQWVAPSKMRNQIMLMRKSYRYEGNTPDRVVNVEFNVGGKKTKLWYDFEEWQHSLKWREEVEMAYWYSEYNRGKDGQIKLKDDNGKPIPHMAGVHDQIPNNDTYSTLTTNKLKATVRDVLYGASDAQKTNVVLFTGTGGAEEFDKAIKSELASSTYIKAPDGAQFIGGSGRNLTYGGFFTSYQHIDGHTITVAKLPLYDNGAVARASEKHPETGLPLESYRMTFLDMSTYDGQDNVVTISRKGREMVRWAVAGATVPPGFSGNATRANDKDGASVHFLKEGGIQIRRATNCFSLTCNKS